MAKARDPSPYRQPFGPRKIPPSIPIVLAAWAAGYILAVIVPTANPFARFIQDLAAPLLVIVACALAGSAVLAWLKADWLGPVERLLAGAGLGLGALGLATFFLGLGGFTNVRMAPLLLLFVGIFQVPRVLESLAAWRREAAAALGPLGWTLMALAAVSALVLVWSAWGSMPGDDAMTWVLALPKAWLHGGAIRETPNNVYGYFPLGAGMLMQAAMGLHWDDGRTHDAIARGTLVAGTFNAYLGILGACAAAALAARLFGAKAAAPAAALLLALPATYLAGCSPGVENAEVLYGTLTLLALAAYAESRRTGAALLAGVMTGLAFGAAYAAFVLLFVPGLLFVFGAGFTPKGRTKGPWGLPAYVAGAAAAAMPWLVRDAIWTGNPFHPMLTGFFGPGPYWTPEQAARFAAGHGPPADLLFSIGRAVAPESLAAALPVVLVLGLAGVGLAAAKERGAAALLAGFYAAAVFIGWFLTTAHEVRELAPLWVALAALAAGGVAASEGLRRPGTGPDFGRGALAAACVAVVLLGLVYAMESQRAGTRDAVVADLPPGAPVAWKPPTWSAYVTNLLNRGQELPKEYLERLPAGAPVAVGLVGEDRTLGYARPVVYNTPWDEPWLRAALVAWRETGSADAVRAELRKLGVVSIYVNYARIDRLRESARPGWPDELGPALFEAWVRAGVLKAEAAFGPRREAGRPAAHVVYRVAY